MDENGSADPARRHERPEEPEQAGREPISVEEGPCHRANRGRVAVDLSRFERRAVEIDDERPLPPDLDGRSPFGADIQVLSDLAQVLEVGSVDPSRVVVRHAPA